MSRTKQMTDFDERAVSAAEADLERLLSIEPSPGFAALVRERIAADERASSWSWGRLGLALAATCALVVGLTLRGGEGVRDDEPTIVNRPHQDIALIPDAPKSVKAIVPDAPAIDVRPHVHRPRAASQREPEIIIDSAIAEAIRRLAVASRNTALDASKGENIAAPDAESEALPVPEPLDVPEIVLRPADQAGGQ